MTRVVWDQPGEKRYETGIDRGVLYVHGLIGVPWNGLVSVNETSVGGEITPLFFDGIKYFDLVANEEFQAVMDAYTYPEEFNLCDGYLEMAPGLFATRQQRKQFDLCYRTKIGNDVEGVDHNYKLNLIWNATISPTVKAHTTLSDTPTVGTFSWTINAVPVDSNEMKPTAHLVIDANQVDEEDLTNLEDLLYGTAVDVPYMPDQDIVIDILRSGTVPPYDPTPGDPLVQPPYIVDGGAP